MRRTMLHTYLLLLLLLPQDLRLFPCPPVCRFSAAWNIHVSRFLRNGIRSRITRHGQYKTYPPPPPFSHAFPSLNPIKTSTTSTTPAQLYQPQPPSPSLPPTMILLPTLTALLAATAFPPRTMQARITKKEPTSSIYCLPVSLPPRPISAPILPRKQRARPHKISLSPPTLAGPSTSTTRNVTKRNDSTSSAPQAIPPPPAWVLTLEDIVTVIFRIVITILTLFNVNITWRIRGEWHRSPCAEHGCQSARLMCPIANQDRRRPRGLRHAWAGVRLEIV